MNPQSKSNNTPIVAVMGHVDHGKTSLLDKIRGTKVVDTEYGGITQSVRAHQIEIERNGETRKITFIDTPGHEAFRNMRSRGSQIANIAIIVVAQDDGIQPQTIESAKFAKNNNIPIIIALNKIDLPGENLNKILTDLSSKAGINTEEFGGDAILCKVSAKTGEGIDKLLDTILLLDELHPQSTVKTDTKSLSEGIVLESNATKALGNVALIILKSGILTSSKNLFVASSNFSSKIRSLMDSDLSQRENFEAGDPVWVTGLLDTINVGQTIRFFADKDLANAEVEEIKEEESENINAMDPFASLKKFAKATTESNNEKKVLNIVLRTDTVGSLEVVKEELKKLNDEFAEIKIKEERVGEVVESDIKKARDIGAIVIGFRTKVQDGASKLAKQEKVLVRSYEIIYEMIDELEEALTGLLEPEEVETEIARALVKNTFKLTDGNWVAGCVVTKGLVIRGYRVWVERNGEIIHKGKIASLKILKQEVKEVEKGKECGILIEPNIEILIGDQVVPYKIEK